MSIIKTLFGIFAILFVTVSHATIVEVSYKGWVFNVGGDGVGYEVGDKISGSLFINTDLAPEDSNPFPSSASYYNLDIDDYSGFVSGYASGNSWSSDYVEINDDADSLDQFEVQDEEIYIYEIDSSNYGSSRTTLRVGVEDYMIDFIHGDSLEQNFKLHASDGLFSFFGGVKQRTIVVEDDVVVVNEYSYANFHLSKLTVRPVPEPSLLILLVAGLAGLGFTRKRNKLD